MTLKDKRLVIQRFMAGEDIVTLEADFKRAIMKRPRLSHPGNWPEAIIRDYINGTFKLRPVPPRNDEREAWLDGRARVKPAKEKP